MTSQAAKKIVQFRHSFSPPLTGAAFGARYGVKRMQVWKWERRGAVPSPAIVIEMHNDGIVAPGDWYLEAEPDAPVLCGRCERRTDDPAIRGCMDSGCPRRHWPEARDATAAADREEAGA